MAKATFVHDGKAIDYTPTAAVTGGDVVVLGDAVAIAKIDIAANTLGALHATGVFDFPKTAGVGEGITAGSKVYWDVADGVAKTDDETGANEYIGKAVKAAGDDDTIVRVRLEQ